MSIPAILKKLLSERIMIIDGAMGTMIQKHKLTEEDYRGERFRDYAHSLKGNNDLLVLTQPQIIVDIHRAFLESGADILETNTFSANAISMADYHMENLVWELNVEATKLPERPQMNIPPKIPINRVLWPAPLALPTALQASVRM